MLRRNVSPEAIIGFALAVGAMLIALLLTAKAGKARQWSQDRIEKVSGAISLSAFAVAFVIAIIAESRIAEFLEYLQGLF
jgi:hypothetical protein